MTQLTPSRLETVLGSVVAAWLILSSFFVPIGLQRSGAEAHRSCSHHLALPTTPSGTRQLVRLMLRRTLGT
jgi:hypothetical protein